MEFGDIVFRLALTIFIAAAAGWLMVISLRDEEQDNETDTHHTDRDTDQRH